MTATKKTPPHDAKPETFKTAIWREEPEENNPYAASACYCAGYDVYGDLLGNIGWSQYLYLLLKQELPSKTHLAAFEILAVAIANPGMRDHSVRAAMNAGVGGSTSASALMAALAVGAGNLNGGHEVAVLMAWCQELGANLEQWQNHIVSFRDRNFEDDEPDTWLPLEHIPGFDTNGDSCPKPVLQTLEKLEKALPGGLLSWLLAHRLSLESTIGYPLAMSGVCAMALFDMAFNDKQAEMLFLLLRLPGAAAHALEQQELGWKRYPFFKEALTPMSKAAYAKTLKDVP